jgi:D-serine deaminase-like pyridoxal phosphate-dependent protein
LNYTLQIKRETDMWYNPTNEASIYTPAVLVYPDRIEENIRRMISLAGSAERLRPHVKTHKMAEVIRLQVEHGIRKFKCATLTEVALVAANGGEDILLAYPLTGPAIGHFMDLNSRFPKTTFAVTVDSVEATQKLSEKAKLRGMKLDVFVDLDNGMHRTGIMPDQAEKLISSILKNKYLLLKGFHIYDGHIHEKEVVEREAHCKRDFESVNKLVKRMEEEGIEVKELACGGTPTFPIHAGYTSRTLCPGTPLLWDAGYAATLPDLDFLPAAVIAARVISKPGENVCLDLGYKAVASEMPHPRVSFLDLGVPKVINHSEEHFVASSPEFSKLSIGDVVYALPMHVCPTIALHEQVYVVEKQIIEDVWKVIARSRNYKKEEGLKTHE